MKVALIICLVFLGLFTMLLVVASIEEARQERKKRKEKEKGINEVVMKLKKTA